MFVHGARGIKKTSKFSKENKKNPSKIPDALKNLTQVEEMLIYRDFPVRQIHTKLNGGQKAYKGHVITLPNDVQILADTLLRHPKDIPVILFKFNGKDNKPQELKVRRKNVEDALMWLTGTNENRELNNILYKDITIDYDLLESLPVNGYLPETKSLEFDSDELDFDSDVNELPDLGPMNSDENVYNERTDMWSVLAGNLNSNKGKAIINNEVLSPQKYELALGSDPLNEFNTENLPSLCFPTLFPDTKGDPTNSCLLRNI